MERGHENLVNAITSSAISEDKMAQRKSKEVSQKGRVSVVNAKADADKSTKAGKFALDLEQIFLDNDALKNSDEYEFSKLERTEYSATLKVKGGWKQLSRRQEVALQMQ